MSSPGTRAAGIVPPLSENEVRFLRRCVRYLLDHRGRRPSYSDLGITPNKAQEIRELANTFVEQDG
jgi:hypothetical protein